MESSPVTVTLTAVELQTQPTVTFYSLNGGAQTTYTAPFAVSNEGTTVVRVWSQDGSVPPNVEDQQIHFVRIDRTGPTFASTIKPEHTGRAAFSYGLVDDASGPAGAFWSLDGILLPQNTPSGNQATVFIPGVHTLAWRGFDVAGNEATGSVSFNLKRAQTLTRSPAKSTLTLTRRAGVVVWRPSITIRATPATAPYTGTVPLAGKSVRLQRSVDGGRTWKTLATKTTSSKGAASAAVTFRKTEKAQWRWYSAASSSIASAASASTIVTVR